ncbi:NOL1/NOP2/sun family putative RNA methylase [candidate division KSB1 bacterium]|nr:NOL1/NOP2/sun family putative RNA methylase [candidate division KSB1 bacterium]
MNSRPKKKIVNQELYSYLQTLLGNDLQKFSSAADPPVSIRVNTLKTKVEKILQQLVKWDVNFMPHPFNPASIILENDFLPMSHTLDFFLGNINYQGVASQLPVMALNPQPGETILDLAASPGSKSTQIAALMRNRGKLFLNDVSNRRMQPLLTNLNRNGVIHDAVFNLPGQRIGRLFPNRFDRVLLDAPCTNLGKLPGQLYSNARLSGKAAAGQADLQYYLLVSALKAVKVGGLVVYSTCSLSVEENEMVINRILERYPRSVSIEACPIDENRFQEGITKYHTTLLNPSLNKARRIYPFSYPFEGFFMACLRKTSDPAADKTVSVPAIPLYDSTNDDIASILENIKKMWGIDIELLRSYTYRLTTKKLWLLSPVWKSLPETGFYKAGLPLATPGKEGWKLTNAGAQFFAPHIRHHLLELGNQELQRLFEQGELDWHGHADGYYILTHDQKRLATVSLFNNKLKIRLPHRFRLFL